jgi:TPR repeat protein
MYLWGTGVPNDEKKASVWLELAAKDGLAMAQYHLGVMNEKGQGLAQDYAEAAKWYGLAAEQGVPEAQYHLGVLGCCRFDGHRPKLFELSRTLPD